MCTVDKIEYLPDPRGPRAGAGVQGVAPVLPAVLPTDAQAEGARMTYQLGRDAVDGYVWLDDPRVELSSGPSHARNAEKTDPPYVPPTIRLGFAPPRREVDEPLIWEGDDT